MQVEVSHVSIKLVDLNNTGPELLKYEQVIAAINRALDDVMDGRRNTIDALQLIDYHLFANKLSTYRDCSFAKTDNYTIRNFNNRMCKGCNFKVPYDYIVHNGLDKSTFYADGKWYKIVKEEDDT